MTIESSTKNTFSGPKRTPRNYDGVHPTSHEIKDVLAGVLRKIGYVSNEKGAEVLSSWKEIVGEPLSAMTKAISFVDGNLTVNVSNSSLYSLLNQYEKKRLIQVLRTKFPHLTIKTIFFRIG